MPSRTVSSPGEGVRELSKGKLGVARSAFASIWAQGVSSASNFVLVVALARGNSQHLFGAFALNLTILMFAMSVSRSLIVEPLLATDFSGSDEARLAERQALTASVCTGLITSLAALVVSRAFEGHARRVALTAAAVATPLLVQDAYRYVFFARRQPLRAGVIDTIWLASFVALLQPTFSPRAATGLLCWGFGALISLIAASLLSGVGPGPSPRAWLRRTSHLGPRYVAEFLVVSGCAQLTLAGLATVSGLGAVGSLKAAQTLFGPINIIFFGSYLMLVPVGRRLLHHQGRRALRVFVLLSFGFATVTLLWMLAALVLPDGAGRVLFGASWNAGRALILPLGFMSCFGAIGAGAILALRSAAAARASLRVRLVGAPALVVFPLIGAMVRDAEGFVIGSTFALAVAAALWWAAALTMFRGLERDSGPATVGLDADVAMRIAR
jgi:hypothetical protein